MSRSADSEPNVLTLHGEVDLHESPQLAARLSEIIERKHPRVVVDMSGVSYIDSSGLATLIDALNRVKAYGGELALAGIDNVRTVFEIARLDQVFKIYPNTAAALRS